MNLRLITNLHERRLKVIRIAAKTRELISTSVDHLTLHQTLHTIITEQTTKEEIDFIESYHQKKKSNRDFNVLAEFKKNENKGELWGGVGPYPYPGPGLKIWTGVRG